MEKPIVQLYKLGKLSYSKSLKVQQVLFTELKNQVTFDIEGRSSKLIADARRRGHGNSLILVEHEPVYTIGLRSKEYNDDYVIKLKKELDRHNLRADLVGTNRGGLITFHGPGQLVVYPILYLGDFRTIKNKSLKAYVNNLEATIIDTLASIGLGGAHTVREYPGVWLDSGQRKIAFIGIACKRFTTMHGISINCNCDLTWFDHIVSCGIKDKAITSVHEEMLTRYKASFDDQKFSITESSCRTTDPKFLQLGDTSQHHNNEYSDYGIERISKAFCYSFSKIFDCKLIEDHYVDPKISNLITQ